MNKECLTNYISFSMWKLLFFAFLIFSYAHSQPQVEVWVAVDKKNVNINENVELCFVVLGNKDEFTEPSFACENLELIPGSQKTISANINDDGNQLLQQFKYVLKPDKLGKAKIKNILYVHKGETVEKKDIEINIISEKSDGPTFWVEVIPTSFSVYCYEVVQLNIRYYQPFATQHRNFSYNIKESKEYELLNAKQVFPKRIIEKNNYLYYERVYSDKIVIARHGKIKIEFDSIIATVYMAEKENEFDKVFGQDDFFQDDFFREKPLSNEFGGKELPFSLSVSPLFIEARQLPTAPNDFCGAVGHFSVTTNINTNDKFITLNIVLSGKGNLQNLNGKFIKESNKFKVIATEYAPVHYIDNIEVIPVVKRNVTIKIEVIDVLDLVISPYFCFFSPEKGTFQYIDIKPLQPKISFSPKSSYHIWLLLLLMIVILVFFIFYRKKIHPSSQ